MVQAHRLHGIVAQRPAIRTVETVTWPDSGECNARTGRIATRCPRHSVDCGQRRDACAERSTSFGKTRRSLGHTPMDFRGEPGRFCLVPDTQRQAARACSSAWRAPTISTRSPALPQTLPAGNYRLDAAGLRTRSACALHSAGASARIASRAIANPRARRRDWRSTPRRCRHVDADARRGIWRVRDLVNTPTEDMGPAELAAEVKALAQAHGGEFREWVGDQLLNANFPTIHAVGRASHRTSRDWPS